MWVRSALSLLVVALALVIACPRHGPGMDGAQTQAVSDEFSILYDFVEYGGPQADPDMILSHYEMAIRSTGEYSFNITCPGMPWVEDTRVEGTMSTQAAANVYNAFMAEGPSRKLDHYLDLGYSTNLMEERLTVVSPSCSRSIVFEGYSMEGLLPVTSKMLYNQIAAFQHNRSEPLDLELELSASTNPGTTKTTVSLSVTNNEDFAVSKGAVCSNSWPARIVRMNGFYVKDLQGAILPECVMTFEPGTTTQFTAQTWDWAGVAPGPYVLMVPMVSVDFLILNVPAYSSAPNAYPVASFTVDPPKGNRTTVFEFDATLTCDPEDNETYLQMRWDWEGDGIWDADWANGRKYTHVFADDGKYDVVMQVKDSGGLTNQTSLRVTVGDPDRVLLVLVVGGSLLAVAAVTVGYLLLRSRRVPKA